MKLLTINLAAPWAGTIETFQDSNALRETNFDSIFNKVGDRFGYLKTTVDSKVGAANNVTFTGTIKFNESVGPTPVEFQQGVLITALGLEVTGGGISVSNGPIVVGGGTLSFSNTVTSGVVSRYTVGSDAAFTITAALDEVRVPQLTANRVWIVDHTPAPSNGRKLRVTRPRTADAFSLTLQREDTTVLGVFAASTAGWIDLIYDGAWKVSGHTGASSVNTDV